MYVHIQKLKEAFKLCTHAWYYVFKSQLNSKILFGILNFSKKRTKKIHLNYYHGLQTPNEDKSKNLKNWANVADKICFGRTLKFGSGSEFSAVQ